MLTSISVRNFKQFEDITVDLDDVVVFVGPNDSGKTTALQALSVVGIGIAPMAGTLGHGASQ